MKYIASQMQRQYWLQNELVPGNSAYNLPFAFQIVGDLEPHLLEQAVCDVLKAHPVFTSSFLFEDGSLFCQENENASPQWQVMDASMLSVQALDKQLTQFACQPFDLSTGPLIRFMLLSHSNEKHTFVIVIHHSATDLRTNDLFATAVSNAYKAKLDSGAIQLGNESSVHYQEYVSWYQDWKQSEAAKRHTSYWKERFSPPVADFDFPLDYPRLKNPSLAGETIPVPLSPQLSARVHEFARTHRSSPFLVLLAAYCALLYRYANQDEFAIGIPLTNRCKENDKDIMGCMMNILPIAVRCHNELRFDQLLQQVREDLLMAHRHQSLPFTSIVEAVNPVREQNRNPIYQTLFTFAHPMELQLEGVGVSRIDLHAGGAQLDLSMVLWDAGTHFDGHLEFSSDIISQTTAHRVVNHFVHVLDTMVEEKSHYISDFSLLSADEYALTVKQWNATKVDYEPTTAIHHLFERQVEKTPDAIALEMPDMPSFTYAALNQRANQLAHMLISSGVNHQDVVGIYLKRSVEMVLAIYAIEKAGAVYVPLDPDHPRRRIQEIMDDADVRLVLADKSNLSLFEANKVIGIDSSACDLDKYPKTNPVVNVNPKDNAYIIFTSGSTGRPKGAINHHQGIINRIQWMQSTFLLCDGDVVLQKTPFSFDVSVWEFFWPLMCGAKLVMAPPGAHRDPAALCELIEKYEVSTIHFVPSMLEAFLEAPKCHKCVSIQRIICSGEALGISLKERCFERLDTQLHNLYGPTEAAVDVTHWPCHPGDSHASVPIGKPIANTTIYILDTHMNPMPIGVPGELYIGGVQVAKGYVGRDDLTARQFVPDPFSTEPGAKLYKSGDLARFWSDGNIEYLGRIDDQVKIHGQRIELGEINAAIEEEVDSVQRALTVVDKSGPGEQLVSYLVTNAQSETLSNILRERLAARLPVYMVPSQFICLHEMPVTHNGKVNRAALPKPSLSSVQSVSGETPRTETERSILEVWKTLLHLEDICVERSFFDVGGTSILAAHLVNKLSTLFHQSFSLVSVFEHTSIRSFASYVSAAAQRTESDTPPLQTQLRNEKIKKAMKQRRLRQRRP